MPVSSSQSRIVHFGPFEVNFAAREIRKHGVRVRLPGQPFDILAILLESAGDIVTREELRQRLWPADTFVDFEHGMNNAVKKLRSALSDSANHPLYIETLPRVGYRFIAPLDQIDQKRSSSSNLPGTRSVRWRVVLRSAIAIMVLIVGSYLYFRRAPRLTEKDSIVVADLANTTGDAVFDDTLREGLSVQLEQTPFLQLVSDAQIGQTLRLMEKSSNTRLTPEIAREVCQRANATTEIEGSIALLGKQYVLGLKAVNCSNGETLAAEQVTADSKERVLSALTTAVSNLRSKLGESRTSLQRFDAPLDQVTTPSLEALQAWSLGNQALLDNDLPSAVSFFRRAVEIDPNFAMAYSSLGVTYYLVGKNGGAHESITRAYELRDHASERERFFISSNYNAIATGDKDKSAQICDQWTKIFPRDPLAFFSLSVYYEFAGRWDEALAAAREMLRLDPTPVAYRTVAGVYAALGRLDEARATIHDGEAKHIDPATFRDLLYSLAFIKNDSAEMARFSSDPWMGPPALVDEAQSYTAAYYGHLARARDLEQRAISSTKEAGAGETTTQYRVHAALLEALFGNFPAAQKILKDAGDFMINRDLEGEVATIGALSGDSAQAQKLTNDVSQRFPEYTYARFGFVPAIRGILAVQRGNLQQGIEDLRAISSRELMAPDDQTLYPMLPVYISGEAYLAAHQGVEAVAEFQMIIEHSSFVWNGPIGALAHLGLGRAWSLAGDKTRARAAYRDFLTLWKDADPDVPVLKEAKAEYARLQ